MGDYTIHTSLICPEAHKMHIKKQMNTLMMKRKRKRKSLLVFCHRYEYEPIHLTMVMVGHVAVCGVLSFYWKVVVSCGVRVVVP